MAEAHDELRERENLAVELSINFGSRYVHVLTRNWKLGILIHKIIFKYHVHLVAILCCIFYIPYSICS